MCTTCGCPNDTHTHNHHHSHSNHDHHHEHPKQPHTRITVEEDILSRNNSLAATNRLLFRDKGIFVLNLVSSPGSGKTTLLERTLCDLRERYHCAVIEGDQQTDNDARRIAATGVPVRQINTGAGCHLDAHMIMRACEGLELENLDLLPHLDFDVKKCREYALQINPDITILEVSARSGEGLEPWYQWLATGTVKP